MKVDSCRLNDSAIDLLALPSLHELCLFNCGEFTGKLLSEIRIRCRDLRSLHLGSVADKRGRAIDISDLESLLGGCNQLETLLLGIDVSTFLRHSFAWAWTSASSKLVSLEIGYISSLMLTEMLIPTISSEHPQHNLRIPVFPNLQKLCLSVHYITNTIVRAVDALARSRPYLHVGCHGEELGTTQWDHCESYYYVQDYEEMDELVQWLLDREEEESNDEEMEEEPESDEDDANDDAPASTSGRTCHDHVLPTRQQYKCVHM